VQLEFLLHGGVSSSYIGLTESLAKTHMFVGLGSPKPRENVFRFDNPVVNQLKDAILTHNTDDSTLRRGHHGGRRGRQHRSRSLIIAWSRSCASGRFFVARPRGTCSGICDL